MQQEEKSSKSKRMQRPTNKQTVIDPSVCTAVESNQLAAAVIDRSNTQYQRPITVLIESRENGLNPNNNTSNLMSSYSSTHSGHFGASKMIKKVPK